MKVRTYLKKRNIGSNEAVFRIKPPLSARCHICGKCHSTVILKGVPYCARHGHEVYHGTPYPAPVKANANGTQETQVIEKAKEMLIDDLEIGVRTYNALDSAGLKTVRQLLIRGRERLYEIRGFGRMCMIDLESGLLARGIVLHSLRAECDYCHRDNWIYEAESTPGAYYFETHLYKGRSCKGSRRVARVILAEPEVAEEAKGASA